MKRQKFFLLLLSTIPVYGIAFAENVTSTTNKPNLPTFSYWDNWSDADGVSHLTKCKLSNFVSENLTPSSDKIFSSKIHTASAKISIRMQPKGWKGSWIKNQHIQWIVPLTGVYFVQAMDGTRVELNSGDVLLSEDLSTPNVRNKNYGHLSGNIGDDNVSLLITELSEAPSKHKPCQWK